MLVAWMLTPNDYGKDGGKRSYLQQPDKWRHCDEPLFDFLLSSLGPGVEPEVDIIESSSILPRTKYFSDMVPGERETSKTYNGFELPSKPIGQKNSCKYVAWSEVQCCDVQDICN